jgi:predicted nuclease of predicted toxin-antitoxin system
VAQGHDVVWAGDWPEDPGDEEILERARLEDRILITLDKDFGELAVVYRRPHRGIIRLVDLPAARQGPMCARVLDLHAIELAQGAILTVEAGRVRIRPADAAGD